MFSYKLWVAPVDADKADGTRQSGVAAVSGSALALLGKAPGDHLTETNYDIFILNKSSLSSFGN